MKAIMLAAGVGKRLKNSFDGKPKCLLDFEGETLLSRHMTALTSCKIEELLIVTGYQHDMIEHEIKRNNSSLRVSTVYNPDYREGSVVSLFKANEFFTSRANTILMDADVLYDPKILHILINSAHENCFLLDRDFEPGNEPVKLCVAGGNLIDFRKQIHKDVQFDFQGESIGFFKFSATIGQKLVDRADQYIKTGRQNEPYEEVIRDLLLEYPEDFCFEDITGLPWLEIDFPEDVTRATQDILPKIKQVEL